MNENQDPLIANFPTEIASKTFICYPPHSRIWEFRPQRWKQPVRLGGVCQKWRRLSWTNGDIYLEVITLPNSHSSLWHLMNITLPMHLVQRLCGSPGGNLLNELTIPPFKKLNERREAFDVAFSMEGKPSRTYLTLTTYRLANVDISLSRRPPARVEYRALDECFELMRRAPFSQSLLLFETMPSSGVFPIPTQGSSSLNFLHWKFGIRKYFLSPSHLTSFIERSSFVLPRKVENRGRPIILSLDDHLHVSSLEHLKLLVHFRCKYPFPYYESVDQLCALDTSFPFLSRIQTLQIGPQLPFLWESLLQTFSSPNRRSLSVKIFCQRNSG